ncbi:PIN domain-containing protein [Fulvimarina endophytica]|uniref:PIN domain-containing protein n=1 Tax=Fulvimarina endophytica TaxID=2293836 RepID=UPI0018F46831|nr:PIN domain-containing protein [Fulvimarina endophytica]
MLAPLSLTTIPLDEAVAFAAGLMRSVGDRAGLSLGDRVCLSLAKTRGAAVLTADRAWQSIDVGVEVKLIR